uniref:Oligopeptidase A N-terminal domain-containing protein n=1 Tax=Triticum aestivum TaxID=4565 RepID=A0A080YUV5_WHEAT|nr:unnamed protein product [Triticum aestivum]
MASPGSRRWAYMRIMAGTIFGGDHGFYVMHRIETSNKEGKLEELEKGVEPSWECLVHPLERIIDRLNIIDHIKDVKDSPDLCAAIEDV